MMSPTCPGARKVISSIAAVTAGPPLWRCATAPAGGSASFIISPPWAVPGRVGSLGGSGMPEKGTPEYDWLYGSSSQAPPGDATQQVPAQGGAGPDETRVMPVARREARGSGGQPPGGTRTATAAPPPRPQPEKRRRRPRLRLGLIPLLLVAFLVYLVGVPL